GGPLENRYRILDLIISGIKERCGNFPVLVKLNAYDGRRGGMRIGEAVKISKMLERSGCCAVEVSCGMYEDGLMTIRGDTLPVDAAFAFLSRFRSMGSIRKNLFRFFAPLLVKRHFPLENYNVDAAAAIKRCVSIPVIVCGGIRTLPSIIDILGSGKADCVSLSRPFIIEPDIVKKFRTGQKNRSACIGCNFCTPALEHAPLRCYFGKMPQ
ncbi:MAG: NADH:flavin oxidoreductase, partial [Spirochaetota bacterium]